MGLDRERLFIRRDAEVRRIWSALPIRLVEVVASDRDTIILADEVILDEEVQTGGHSLSIVCRRLTIAEGKVSTRGKDASRSFQPGRAERGTGQEQALDGPVGADGGPGDAAGAFALLCDQVIGELVIDARGGNGGRPQDGGDGLDGAQGGEGAAYHPLDRHPASGEQNRGRAGSPGGKPGLPGYRGMGGAGGTVTIRAMNLDEFNRTLDVRAGDPGAPGVLGKVGRGGRGGPGGKQFRKECHDITSGGGRGLAAPAPLIITHLTDDAAQALLPARSRDEMRKLSAAALAKPLGEFCFEVDSKRRGEEGAQGPDGSIPQELVDARLGAPVSTDGAQDSSPLTVEDLAASFDATVLSLISEALEERYQLFGSTPPDPPFIEALNFFLRIASAMDGHRGKDALSAFYGLAKKIELGLDFYGYRLNQAPLLSFEAYAARVDRAIPVARVVEETFFAYWDAGENADAKRASLRRSVSAAQERAADLTAEIVRVNGDTKQALGEIDALNLELPLLLHFLMERQEELTAAIRNSREGCDLLTVVSAAATIVAGIATGGAALVAAAGAGAKLYSTLTTDVPDPANTSRMLSSVWDKRKIIENDLKVIGDKAKTVSENVDSIQEAIATLRRDREDMPQFRMAREAFDAVAKSYLDMPEAAEYKDAGYNYIQHLEARNQRILDYNALITIGLDLQVQHRSALATVDAVDSALTGSIDPSSELLISAMSRLYRTTVKSLGQMVHAERKALAYSLAAYADSPQAASSVGALAATHARVMSDAMAAKERFAARIALEEDTLTVALQEVVSAAEWQEFKESGILTFTIRQDHPRYRRLFRNLPGLRITGVKIDLNGARLSGHDDQIPWRLTQNGFERIFRADGVAVEFSHRAIQFPGFSSVTGSSPILKSDFSENSLFSGVSPYSGWLFQIDGESGVDLSELIDAKLTLSGYVTNI